MNPLDYCIDKVRQHDSGGRIRVYAVATCNKGKIIAEYGNSYIKSHPMQAMFASAVGLDQKKFLHAEVGCLIACMRRKVLPHKLYVARVCRNGDIAPACPCPICQHALELSGVRDVITT